MSEAAAWPTAPERGVLGMWVFIGSEVLFFGGLMAAYLYARFTSGPGFTSASRHTDVVLGTLNTGVLLTSSAVIALAVACAQHHRHRRWTSRLLWLTFVLGLAFLVIKGTEYRREWQEGLWPSDAFTLHDMGARIFFMLYFVMTGLHAVHLLCGMTAVAVFARGAARARSWVHSERLEALALYWHFVDVVWVFLYPFLYLVERHS
jgi:cytochrome c oxidase subunit III